MYGAKSIGGGTAAGAAAGGGQALHALPFTGMNTLELALAGFVLVAAGTAVARLAPRRRREKWADPAG